MNTKSAFRVSLMKCLWLGMIILFLFAIACFAFLPLFIGLVRAAFYEEIKAEANGSSRCPACGTYVHSKSAFCQNCGAPLHADPRAEGPSAPAVTEPEPPAAPAEEAAEEAEEAVEQAAEGAASAANDAEQALKNAEDAASDMLDEFNPEN